jgi:hypothetical protein
LISRGLDALIAASSGTIFENIGAFRDLADQAADFLTRDPNASEEEMAEAMDDVICRCGTHPRVMKAMKRAANQIKAKGGVK